MPFLIGSALDSTEAEGEGGGGATRLGSSLIREASSHIRGVEVMKQRRLCASSIMAFQIGF